MNFINNQTPLFGVGGGVPAGGTKHAGHANFATLITPYVEKTPVPTSVGESSDYADPMKEPIVTAPSVTWKSAGSGKKRLKLVRLQNGTFGLVPENDTIEGEIDFGGESPSGPLRVLPVLDDGVSTTQMDSLVSGSFLSPDDPFRNMGGFTGSEEGSVYHTPRTASPSPISSVSTMSPLKGLPKPSKTFKNLEQLQERLDVLVNDIEEGKRSEALEVLKRLPSVKDLEEMDRLKYRLMNLKKDDPTFSPEQISKFNQNVDRIYESYFPFPKIQAAPAFNNTWDEKNQKMPKIEKETEYAFLEKQTKPQRKKPNLKINLKGLKESAGQNYYTTKMEANSHPNAFDFLPPPKTSGRKRKYGVTPDKTRKKRKITEKKKPNLKINVKGLKQSAGQNIYSKGTRLEAKSKPKIFDELPEPKTRNQLNQIMENIKSRRPPIKKRGSK